MKEDATGARIKMLLAEFVVVNYIRTERGEKGVSVHVSILFESSTATHRYVSESSNILPLVAEISATSILTNTCETNFGYTNHCNRECSRHARIIRCHNQYVCGICLEGMAQPKLTVATPIISACNQIARWIRWIESAPVNGAVHVNATVAPESVVTSDKHIDSYSLVVVDIYVAAPRRIYLGICGEL